MNENVRGMLIFSVISIFVLSFAPFTAFCESNYNIQIFFNGRSKFVMNTGTERIVENEGPEMFGDEFPVAVPTLTLIGNIMMILTSFVILIVGSTYLYYSIFMFIGSGLAFTGTMLYIEFGQIFTEIDMYFFIGFYYCAVVYGILTLKFLYGIYDDLSSPKKRDSRMTQRLSVISQEPTQPKSGEFIVDTPHGGIVTYSEDTPPDETSLSDEDAKPAEKSIFQKLNSI
ncbi:MAG: hypothetical protein ACTSO7_12530 [Candidatus Heimdallarchaeota archaeon]